jgi:hypothetical protein
LFAGLVVILHQFQPRRLGFLGLMAQQHQTARQIIEQRVQPLIKQPAANAPCPPSCARR